MGQLFQNKLGKIQVRYTEEIFYNENDERLGKVAQRRGRFAISGHTKHQVGQSNLFKLRMLLLIVRGLD